MSSLTCLGTNSSGNCYILECGGECLILDAGVPFKDVKVALDFKINKITAVLVTHEHKDHSKYVEQYKKAGIPVIMPFSENKGRLSRRSNFMIRPFELTNKDGEFVHTNADGSRCPVFGFFITHPEMGKFVYATDCEVIKWRFSKVNHILVEANYDMETLEEDEDSEYKKAHVFRGHHSIQTACRFLKQNNSFQLRTVVLCHLSETNSDEERFKQMAEEAINYPVYVAKKGLVIDL